ncbi:MAG: hypothetical protein WCW84_10075 [Sulfurimonas sp.]|jgi:hypothetical protein
MSSTIQYSNGRTYGECVMEELFSIRMIDGEFVSTIYIKDKPRPMLKENATIYYSEKLRQVWKELGLTKCQLRASPNNEESKS